MKNLKTRLSLFLAFFLTFTLFIGFQSVSADNAVEEAKANVLTYEGMLARTTGNSGIRSLYRIDRAALNTLLENDYTIEIGASMAAAKIGGTEYRSVTDLTVKQDAEKGYVPEKANVGTVVVYSSTGADYATNKFVSSNSAEYKFAFTTVFGEDYENATYYNAEFCYRGFVALTKDGETEIIYVDADGANFGNSISLYEIVGYFVSGDYTGDKAEEYASLPKFHEIVSKVGFSFDVNELTGTINAVDVKKSSDGTEYRLLKKGETSGGAIKIKTPTYTRPGIYEVEITYATNGVAVSSFSFRNNSANKNNKDYTSTATAGTATFFSVAAGAATTDTVDPTQSNISTVKLTSILVKGANSITAYMTGDCSTAAQMGITNVSLRLLSPIDAENGAVYYNLATCPSTSGTDVYTTVSGNATTSPVTFTPSKNGMYRIGGVIGSVWGATWVVTLTDGDRTVNLSQSSSGVHEGYGPSNQNVVYADGFGETYLEGGKTYTLTFTSANNQSQVYGLLVTDKNRDAETRYEYFPKDNAAVAGALLSDGETLPITTAGHNFSITVDRAGVYGIKLKYNSKNQRVGYIRLTNNTDGKTSEARIVENVLTYATTPTDYVVPAADKAGAYQPDSSLATMQKYYFGGDLLYVYLRAGTNSLTLKTGTGSSGTTEFGLYAMQFTLASAIESNERVSKSAFCYGETDAAFKAHSFGPSGERQDVRYVKSVLEVKNEGVYSLSGLFILGPKTTATATFINADGDTVASPTFTWTNATYAFASQTSTSYRYGKIGEDFELPAGTYTVTVSMDDVSNYYLGFSELYMKKVSDIPEPLGTPIVTVDSNGVASWDAIPGASGYEYVIDSGEPIVTFDTSVTLSDGQSIVVKALGEGAYTDSEYSESVTYVPAPKTEWEFDLADGTLYTAAGSVSYADGYLYMPAGNANYIEFTVTAAKAGFYDISFIGKAVDRARIYFVNMRNEGDGWASHKTSAQYAANTTQSSYTRATAQYLYEGENTIRIYVFEKSYYASAVKISLVMEDTADTVHTIVSKSNTTIDQSSDTSHNRGSSGTLWGRAGSVVTFKLSSVASNGEYKLYAFGSAYGTVASTFALSDGTATLPYAPANRTDATYHYDEGRLYEIGTLALLANTDYSLTVTFGTQFGFHRFILVRTGDDPEPLGTPIVTVDSNGVASWDAIPGASGYEYVIDSGEPIVTFDTSVTLSDGQSIVVKALGEGAYTDSEYSESVTYVPAPKTEWEFDLADGTLYTAAGSVSYADGYLYMPAGNANYIEFTVTAAKAGFYDISFIGKAVDRARIYFVNMRNEGDGWASHKTSAQYAANTTQSSYTRATAQYLYEGENTIRIYVFEKSYYASAVKISLVMEDTADTVHTIVSKSNTTIDQSSDTSHNRGSSGTLWGRAGSVVTFKLSSVASNGEYKLYAFGSAYGTVASTFALSDGTATLPYAPANRTDATYHYDEGRLYEIGTLALLANTDYSLTVTFGTQFGFHRFILIRTGDYPEKLNVTDFTADPEMKTLSAKGVFSSAVYNTAVLTAYDKNGNVLASTSLIKEKAALVFTEGTLSLTMTEAESAAFAYARIYAADEDGVETDAIEPFVFTSADTLTATAYTANADSGVFSATVDFESFSGKYATLALYNKAGAIVATTSVEKTGYALSGETLSITLSKEAAATVTAMHVFVTDTKNGTAPNDNYTSFRYTTAGELRLLFVSDLHYNVKQGSSGKNNNLNGMDADARAQHMVNAVLKEHANAPLDGFFLLGDLCSAEDWYKKFDPNHTAYVGNTASAWDIDGDGDVDLDDYYVSDYEAIRILNENYLSQIEAAGIPVYCVPGNHDTIQNEYWEKIFGYKERFGYTETEYIVKFEEQKTAVIMLNTFDEEKGAMTKSRNNDGKNYLSNTQQTLAYTAPDWTLLKSFLDELTAEGYETVYLAAHIFSNGESLQKAAEYPIVKAFIYGDQHIDDVSSIAGVPAFVDGHYSQSLLEYTGEYGERIFDIQRLPFSWILVEGHGNVSTVDYYKEEALYLGKDNYEFLSQYLTLTEGTKENHKIILTRVTNVDTSVAGKVTETIEAGYYNYVIRTDISLEMQAVAARIVHQIETYDMDMFVLDYGNVGYIPSGYASATQTYSTTGTWSLSGTARNWCYNYLAFQPCYESFYKEKMIYKSYEIFAGKATKTYEDTEETTMTNKK